ncbi:MAG: nitrogenase iron-molybdenum cofactor biosynthesis protein NifN [Nitrospinae bacterium]|nr:nitrogenase iron-molybdenum cofactor biosynthesis protein NifN [Nitrospinota bacterium]
MKQPKKNVTVNPLRLSQPSGAALAFLGIKGCIPLWHGVQGCTAFAKILFIQHFREPMPFQTTALTQTSVVMGGEENIFEAVENIKKDARCLGILTTGVAETNGADMERMAREISRKFPGLPTAVVNTPDFEGTLETGWVKACRSALASFAKKRAMPRKLQCAVFAGPYVTPGEVEWISDAIVMYGLRSVIFPDLGDSLYGRLLKNDYYACASGGTTLEEIATLADSAFVISIGSSMKEIAGKFADGSGIPAEHFEHLSDVREIDRFFTLLGEKSGIEAPMKIVRQREHLMDAMLDAQFYFHGRTACVAGDHDFIKRWGAAMEGIGAKALRFSSIQDGECPFGDLENFKGFAEANGADLLIGNSHVADLADETGRAVVRAGIPVYDRFGETQSVRIGYEGLAKLYMDCANALMERPPLRAVPYKSTLQETLR